MSRISRSQRVELWLDRLNRFADSDMTVAGFCASEGISTPSFYSWRNRLADQFDWSSLSRRKQAGNSGAQPGPSRLRSASPEPAKSRSAERSERTLFSQRQFAASPQAQSPPRFAELIVGGQTTGEATIILPGNILIQLGGQPELATAIVREVLQQVAGNREGDSC